MASLIKILDNAKFLSKTVFGDVSPNPTYQLGSSLASVNEGSSVVFTLSTTNVSDGTLVPYVITGVSLADLASGALTGNFTVASGLASASITLANDALTEGSETMTVSLSSGVASASVIVNDTSRTPTYAIGRSLSAVNEGSSVVFTLSTTNVSNGTVLPYTISGISSTDVTTGSLTGSFTVNSGLATATITMSADQLTEGAETATLTLNNAAASNFVVVNDTSVWTPATISGLQLWLDAADTSTLYDATAGGSLVTTDGAAVARWQDKSGNNRHLTQATASARPLLKTSVRNGRNALLFDGVDDFISRSTVVQNSQSYTMFVVLKTENTSVTRTVAFNGNGGGSGYSMYQGTSKRNLLYGGKNAWADGNISINWETWSASCNSSTNSTTFFVNGATQLSLSATPNVPNGITCVSEAPPYSFPGYISEFIMYNTALTTTQRQAVETYLNSKWAIY